MDGLKVQHLYAWYANITQSHQRLTPNQRMVLHDLTFDVAMGQTLAIIGHNGSGRSTLAKTLMGLVPSHGSIQWQGQTIDHLPTHQRARLGFGWVPEQRDVFAKLSVLDNLRLGQSTSKRPQSQIANTLLSIDGLLHLFPQLENRLHVLAGQLSGGEQQMLCIARSLIAQPSLLIVDEATEGLAPEIQQQLQNTFFELKHQQMSMILIDQNQHWIQALADQTLDLQQGHLSLHQDSI